MQITEITEHKKGRSKIVLADGTIWILYKGEIRTFQLMPGMELTEEQFSGIREEVLLKRAKKRALHLLERMDRSESGLREKLRQNEYPLDIIEDVILYVKSCHYIDDERYARNYIQSYQGQRSKQRITMDLMTKGIHKKVIEAAISEVYEADEYRMIQSLLVKKNYHPQTSDVKEQQKIYNFLLRRGYKSEDVLRAMKCRT